MKTVLKLEELGMLIFGIYVFSLLNFDWWWFLVLILTPDIGMMGYLISPKIGTILYNIFHHKGLAILFYLIGIYVNNEIIMLIGIILFSHASLDRLLGYGLKYSTSFNETHLGKIGNK